MDHFIPLWAIFNFVPRCLTQLGPNESEHCSFVFQDLFSFRCPFFHIICKSCEHSLSYVCVRDGFWHFRLRIFFSKLGGRRPKNWRDACLVVYRNIFSESLEKIDRPIFSQCCSIVQAWQIGVASFELGIQLYVCLSGMWRWRLSTSSASAGPPSLTSSVLFMSASGHRYRCSLIQILSGF
jgi:hypothetical protein